MTSECLLSFISFTSLSKRSLPSQIKGSLRSWPCCWLLICCPLILFSLALSFFKPESFSTILFRARVWKNRYSGALCADGLSQRMISLSRFSFFSFLVLWHLTLTLTSNPLSFLCVSNFWHSERQKVLFCVCRWDYYNVFPRKLYIKSVLFICYNMCWLVTVYSGILGLSIY